MLGDDAGMELAAGLYQAAFAVAGTAVRCEARQVGLAELAEAIRQIRSDSSVIGAAVTMPCTVAVTGLLDGLGPEAQAIKAVNTVSHRAGALVGWNTDRSAFARALQEAAFEPKGRSVLVVGAGGAGRACADVLRQTAAKLWISAPDLDQARRLCTDLGIRSGGPAPLGSLSLLVRKVDLIVNATPVGSDGESAPFPMAWVMPQHYVFDLLYHPALTPLVRGARERGARAVNGLSMLLYQALASFEIWTGQPAPEAEMRAALERAVLDRLNP